MENVRAVVDVADHKIVGAARKGDVAPVRADRRSGTWRISGKSVSVRRNAGDRTTQQILEVDTLYEAVIPHQIVGHTLEDGIAPVIRDLRIEAVSVSLSSCEGGRRARGDVRRCRTEEGQQRQSWRHD